MKRGATASPGGASRQPRPQELRLVPKTLSHMWGKPQRVTMRTSHQTDQSDTWHCTAPGQDIQAVAVCVCKFVAVWSGVTSASQLAGNCF